MASAEEIKKEAEKAEKAKAKPLPLLVSPMTRLAPEIRRIIAQFCRDAKQSFSAITELMWVDKLKTLKLIDTNFKLPDVARTDRSGGLREKLVSETKAKESAESKVAALQAQLAALKSKKS